MLINECTDPLPILWGMKREKRTDLQNYFRFSHQDQKRKYQHVFLTTPEPSLKNPEEHRVAHCAAAACRVRPLRTHTPNLYAQVQRPVHGSSKKSYPSSHSHLSITQKFNCRAQALKKALGFQGLFSNT